MTVNVLKYRMFQTRIKKLQKALIKQKFDALLITSVPNIAYLTGVTHFSKEEREAHILVTNSSVYIFTDKRYTDSLTQIPHLSIEEISHQFSFIDKLQTVLKKENIKYLGFEEDFVTYSEFENLSTKFSKHIQLSPQSGLVEQLRIIKDDHEIENLKKQVEENKNKYLREKWWRNSI